MICLTCNAEKKGAGNRVPRGWKSVARGTFCDKCWGEAMTRRAVTMRVTSPLDATWNELRAALKEMYNLSTMASNYIVQRLVMAEPARVPDMKKMPRATQTYLYPELRRQFPGLPSQSVAAMERSVTAKVRALRYESLWTCARSIPSFRHPQPFPVSAQSWTASIENDSPVVSMRIGERRFSLRLKGGKEYIRQLADFRQIVAGEAIPGEGAVYDHGMFPRTETMVKLTAWFPRNVIANPSGSLRVRTAPDSLLVALNPKDEKLWVYNADHIRRWSGQHGRLLQRLAEDSKAEQRPVPSFASRRSEAVTKYHDRMNTAADQAAAYLVKYAARRKLAEIVYDDTDRTFCPAFVWARLKGRILILAGERGIAVTSVTAASGEAEEKSPPPLAKD